MDNNNNNDIPNNIIENYVSNSPKENNTLNDNNNDNNNNDNNNNNNKTPMNKDSIIIEEDIENIEEIEKRLKKTIIITKDDYLSYLKSFQEKMSNSYSSILKIIDDLKINFSNNFNNFIEKNIKNLDEILQIKSKLLKNDEKIINKIYNKNIKKLKNFEQIFFSFEQVIENLNKCFDNFFKLNEINNVLNEFLRINKNYLKNTFFIEKIFTNNENNKNNKININKININDEYINNFLKLKFPVNNLIINGILKESEQNNNNNNNNNEIEYNHNLNYYKKILIDNKENLFTLKFKDCNQKVFNDIFGYSNNNNNVEDENNDENNDNYTEENENYSMNEISFFKKNNSPTPDLNTTVSFNKNALKNIFNDISSKIKNSNKFTKSPENKNEKNTNKNNKKKENDNNNNNNNNLNVIFPTRKISIKNSNFENLFSFSNLFPFLHILKIKQSFISNINFDSDFKFLKKLCLNNLNILDEKFNKIIISIFSNENILNNLEFLSFAKNKITIIDIYKIINENDYSKKFNNLTELNLENNNIYFFASENLNLFPKIKLINLNKNNFSLPENFNELYENLKKKEDVLILFFENLFLFKNNKFKIYLDYFINKINSNKYFYNLQQINLSFFINEKKNINFNYFDKFNFSSNFLFSIQNLNLSFCNLNNEKIINLLMKNFCLFNIKKLILSNNFFDNNIFNYFISNKINVIFNKLKTIDLSGNSNICFNDYENLKTFFIKFNYLKTLNLSKTKFQKDFSDFTKKNIKKFYYDNKKNENNNNINENKTKINISEITYNEKDKKLDDFLKFLNDNNIPSKIEIDSSDIRKNYFLKLKKHKELFINNINFIQRINYKD